MGVTWESCERKWNTLKGTYSNFRQQVDRSGGDSVVLEWPYYDPMHLVLQNSVMAEPEYTFAVGAKLEVKKKDKNKKKDEGHQPKETPENEKEPKKQGLKRPNTSMSVPPLALYKWAIKHKRNRKPQKHKRDQICIVPF